MNYLGLVSGLVMLLAVGSGHIVVIKGEYYFGVRLWYLFLILGLLSIAASIFVDNTFLSSALGIIGFTLLWSIHEIIKQKERVKKGLFPSNPKRRDGHHQEEN